MITQAWEHSDISVELYALKLPLNYELDVENVSLAV